MATATDEKGTLARYDDFTIAVTILTGLLLAISIVRTGIYVKLGYTSAWQTYSAGFYIFALSIVAYFVALLVGLCSIGRDVWPRFLLRMDWVQTKLHLGNTPIERKGRSLVVVFFSYLIGLSFAVMCDGGALASPYAGLFVLNLTLIVYLAEEKRTRTSVVIFSILSAVISYLFYVSPKSESLWGLWWYGLGLHFQAKLITFALVLAAVVAATLTLGPGPKGIRSEAVQEPTRPDGSVVQQPSPETE